MNDTIYIVQADLGGWILPIIILVTAVSQMIQKAREDKANPQAPTPRPHSPLAPEPGPPPVKTEAQEELEDFLKNLANSASMPVEVEPPPPTPAPQHTPVRAPPPLPLPVQPAVIETMAPPPQPVTSRPVAPSQPTDMRSETKTRHAHREDLRLALSTDLIKQHSLQKAILLQEIFDKPLGLRDTPGGSRS